MISITGLTGDRSNQSLAVLKCLELAASKERNCRYCLAAHIACCRMLGVDVEQTLKSVAVADPALREMIRFSTKCARDPQSLTSDDYDGLRQHGLSQTQIVELISMAALAGRIQ